MKNTKQKTTENISENSTQSKNYPSIGFAIGGGGAKAVCQFNLMKQLINNGVKISHIMGSSMGAVIGGVFALGVDPDQAMRKAVKYTTKNNLLNFSNVNFLKESLFNIKFSEEYLKTIFGDKTFADCKIPFAVTTVDLESGQKVLINQGLLWEAVLASTAIPGVFPPIFKDGMYLVDGGLLEETPVISMREIANPDILIGCRIVDTNNNRQAISGAIYKKYYQEKYQKLFKNKKKQNLINNVKGLYQNFKINLDIASMLNVNKYYKNLTKDMKLMIDVILRSADLVRENLFQYQLKESKTDIFMQIEVNDISLFEFEDFEKLLEKGNETAEKHLPEILSLIEAKKKILNRQSKNANLKLSKI